MGLGTWSWGNKLLWGYDEEQDAELQAVFNLAVDRGINLFDTGDSYGTGKLNGQSEKLLGKFMKEYAGSNKGVYPNIGTKFASYPWRLSASSIEKACDESAARLQRPVDIGQMHWSVSNYAPWQEKALWEGLATIYNKGVPLAVNQVQYSLLSRSVGDEVKEVCDELGVAMIAYSPMGLGLLSGRYQPGGAAPPGLRGVLFKERLEEVAPLLAVMEEVARARGKSVPQVAINWCMCKGTVPIPGARSLTQVTPPPFFMEQVKDSLGAMGWRLSIGEVEALEQAARKVPRELVQNIFQTK
ncbi:NADP-dependent oxidoreductase domain-containing protein [Baffinella frigidus]|nr:NADP-dependent oxidoreductase domain-containing protein [Cryptophyta sp. CCMP2293]